MVLSCLVGCAGVPHDLAPAWTGWVAREGGVLHGAEQRRASDTLARLACGRHLNVTVQVLTSERVGAYAWHDGSIFVTAGLLRLLDDDELAAAIAHEMGHLRAEGRLSEVAAFDGCAASGGVETHADAEACQLLRADGMSVHSLAGALKKVRDLPETPAAVRVALDARIRLLISPNPPR